MKTLDEIITVMDHVEFCCTNCKLQYDCEEKECFLEDALHYLKEYRMQLDDIVAKQKKLESEIDHYQEAVRNCEEAENKYKMLSGKLEGFPTADISKNLRY